MRLHGTPEDAARKLNRTENVRVIPPTDPDFARLYPRRNDAESINRNLDDTLWLGRAHSNGHAARPSAVVQMSDRPDPVDGPTARRE